MQLMVNGAAAEFDVQDLPGLLSQLGADGNRVAVMVNGDMVPKADRPTRELHAGDQVEVVTLAAGG